MPRVFVSRSGERYQVVTLLALAAVLSGSRAAAQTKPSSEPPPAPACLRANVLSTEELLRRRGVQKKTFLKEHRLELTVHGGLFGSDLTSTSYVAGGALGGWVSEDFGLEVSADVLPVGLELDEPVSDFFGARPFERRHSLLVLGRLLWSPAHFKVRTNGGSISHGDISVALGAGRLFDDTAQGVALDGGLIIELYTTSWLALRVELRDTLLVQEALGVTRQTHNLNALAGVAFWFPAIF